MVSLPDDAPTVRGGGGGGHISTTYICEKYIMEEKLSLTFFSEYHISNMKFLHTLITRQRRCNGMIIKSNLYDLNLIFFMKLHGLGH